MENCILLFLHLSSIYGVIHKVLSLSQNEAEGRWNECARLLSNMFVHTAQVRVAEADTYSFKLLHHPSYSLDIALFDFLFPILQVGADMKTKAMKTGASQSV